MNKTPAKSIALAELDQAQAVIQEMSKESAPVVQRQGSHREAIDQTIKGLESERFDLMTRRDKLRSMAEAVDAGLSMHLADIEATIRLYQPAPSSVSE